MYLLVLNDRGVVKFLPLDKVISKGFVVVGLGHKSGRTVVSHHLAKSYLQLQHQLDIPQSDARYIFEDADTGLLSITSLGEHHSQGNERVVGVVYKESLKPKVWQFLILSGMHTSRTQIADYISHQVTDLARHMHLVKVHEAVLQDLETTSYDVGDFDTSAKRGDSVLVKIPGERFAKVATLVRFNDTEVVVIFQGNYYQIPRESMSSVITY